MASSRLPNVLSVTHTSAASVGGSGLFSCRIKEPLKEDLDILHRKPSPFSIPCENIQQGEGLIPGLQVVKLEILFKIKREKKGQEEGGKKEPHR